MVCILVHMNRHLLICFICTSFFGMSQEKTTPLSIGETISFESEILGEIRTLNIYLPLNYHPDSAKTYPVIYLLDGSLDEDFIHVAGLVQFGSFSWINMIPETIVVGISNVDRQRDYTFKVKDKTYLENFPTSGGSEKFIEYIEKEVQPKIQDHYKTNESKTLIGQSLGGLLATEILLKHPELFDNYFIISPSLWWDNELLLDFDPKNYTTNKSIYIAVGKEGDIMESEAMGLYLKLLKIKKENTRLFFQFFEEHNHGDVLHQALYDGFLKVFEIEKAE